MIHHRRRHKDVHFLTKLPFSTRRRIVKLLKDVKLYTTMSNGIAVVGGLGAWLTNNIVILIVMIMLSGMFYIAAVVQFFIARDVLHTSEVRSNRTFDHDNGELVGGQLSNYLSTTRR